MDFLYHRRPSQAGCASFYRISRLFLGQNPGLDTVFIRKKETKKQRIQNGEIKLNQIIIRKEKQEDYKKTEHMTLRAFWNIHGPGCDEHLLVHKLRDAKEYRPELSRVAELNGEIVGAIMYSTAKVVDGDKVHEVLTFGPLCVEPTLFGRGIGKKLLEETTELARGQGYAGIVIFGEPDYYPKHGFVTCDHFGITDANGNNFDAFMALPLNEKFAGIHGKFYEAEVFEECGNEEELDAFTRGFPYYKPLTLSCQWLHKERLGRICEIQKNSYTIQFFEKKLPAKLKGSFYKKGRAEFPVVGDYVTFQYNPTGESIILSVCERKSFLKRPDQAKTAVDQHMAANVDYVFIVSSLNNDYSYNRIARYVSVALNGNATPVVVLTKSDLCNNPARYIREVEGLSDRVRVHAVSAITGSGLDELGEYLSPGNTICLLGSSGVGKSTLLNVISGRENMRTSAVRERDSKGRHTTTHRQLIELESGVTIIDTPGMREIGMADVAEGIDDTFSDIVELECQCRFSNCRHDTEPGCAVKAALKDGTLSKERYRLFLGLRSENKKNYAGKKGKK